MMKKLAVILTALAVVGGVGEARGQEFKLWE